MIGLCEIQKTARVFSQLTLEPDKIPDFPMNLDVGGTIHTYWQGAATGEFREINWHMLLLFFRWVE